MDVARRLSDLEPGYDVPALPGMREAEIQTPCLVLDLAALECNLRAMGDYARSAGVGLRVHGKMHKSVDVAKLQHEIGGASGICCQKVSEAEAFARGGIADILVSNEVTDPNKIDRLARLPKLGASGTRIGVCVDDLATVAELSAAATRHGTELRCLVEIDSGANRCGVAPGPDLAALAHAIIAAPGLSFGGIQAYQGAMQHIADFEARKAAFEASLAITRQALAVLRAEGIPCPTVTGGGTGSYPFEAGSGVYTELQCGSYAFMDADYRTVLDESGATMPEFAHALFLLTSIMSHVKPGRAICDAGLKVQSVDSGLPVVFGRDDVRYLGCSDEHGVIADPDSVLRLNDRLKLVPGHCDPTCNLHDWYVGVRNGLVECLWPVSARGKSW
ncbi:D-3-hydroxyaspartate aldolase [Hoeflea marina]|uniref:D-3-hydroxyaspartate aldolase n=1 Tax=Hoeflea marina TaxID=274592 RepID=A0A317PME3_9HYPH|nr:DSD1 family PLP-dependent enzyme [Hoeflea marina]PWW02062.1 D-3-hydroxyaspartate aldolase [Hoeflea marina]